MSFNRENVIWQSPDGTWNRGFFAVDGHECGMDEEYCGDDTHEWCATYSKEFDWVSTGHATEEEAHASWDGVNPGGSEIVSYEPDSQGHLDWISEYEDRAAKHYERATQQAAEHGNDRTGIRTWRGSFTSSRTPAYWGYHGLAKHRTLEMIQAELNAIQREWVGYRLRGVTNIVDEKRREALNEQIAQLRDAGSIEDLEAYEVRQEKFRDSLKTMLVEHRTKRAETARYGFGYHGANQYNTVRERDEREREVEELIANLEANAQKRAAQIAVRKTPTKKTSAKKTSAKQAAPAKKASVKRAAQSEARGKSTAKSTPGSFKTPTRTEAEVTLDGPLDVDHLWG